MPANTPSPVDSVSGLGARKQTFSPTPGSRRFNLIFGVLCVLAAPALMLLAGVLAFNAYSNSGASRVDNVIGVPLCLAAVAFGLGALILFSTWRGWQRAAALYEHGIAFRERGPVQQFRWDEVEAVWQAVTKHYTNGVYTGTTHIYTVQTKDGRKLVLDDRYGKNMEVIGSALQQGTATLLLPRYWQSLQQGQKLSFGPLALDRDKLYAGKKELLWSEIMAVKIERGNISIKKDKGWFAWANATVPQIPNFFVFYELLGRFAKIE